MNSYFLGIKNLVILVMLNFQLLAAQNDYKTDVIKFSDGLSSDIVLFTTKKDGKLYVATQRGLCLYDGYRFIKCYRVKKLTNWLVSKNNNLYFYSAGKGLCFFRSIFFVPQIVSKVNFSDSTPNNDHYDNIYVDNHNRIWCSDFNNIKYFTKFKNYIYPISKAQNQRELNLTFLETRTKQLLIGTQKGVFFWNKNNNKIQLHSKAVLAKAKIISATVINDLVYFITSCGKFIIYNPDSERILIKALNHNLDAQFKFVKNTKSVFFYNKNTLYYYDILKHTKQKKYSTTSTINHVFYDPELQIFWISTNKGLVKLSKKNPDIISLNTPDFKTAISIVQDQNQRIWCVTNTNKIYSCFKYKHWQTYQSPYKNTVFEHLFVFKNQLFATANNGLYSLINGALKLKIKSKIKFKKAIIDHNNLLWIIPEQGAIKVYDAILLTEKKDFLLNPSSFWRNNTFNDIAVAPNGKVWLASWMPKDYGISYFDNKTHLFVQVNGLVLFKNKKKFVTDYYNQIAFLENHKVIFSGYGGWNIVSDRGKILKALNTDLYKVPNDYIKGISQDTKGNIWFACAEGLNQYNFKTNKVVTVSTIDGLSNNDITYGYLALKNNKLLIGTDNGIQLIDLNKITKTKLINKLELTAIINDGRYLFSKNSTYILNHKYTQLDILFSSLSFSNKDKIIYRYQFKGDKKWSYLGAIPKLSLIKLSPGNYTVVIQAGDNLGNWQKKTLQINLIITPPFYYTFWFIGIIISLLIAIGFYVNWYLISQEKIKGSLKQKIKDAQMQTLRSQMNPHFLFNSLNSINSFIIQKKSNEASAYLTTFSKLMRNILDNSRHETISLEKELETLKMYMKLESVRLEHKFDYEIICDKKIEIEIIKIPPLIIQPFVENAIWHGLHNKTSKGHIKIVIINKKKGFLNIKIIDDGIGRKASASLKKQQLTHKSYGVNITQNRLSLFNSKNSFKIIDLVDDDDNATGTQVELQIYYYD